MDAHAARGGRLPPVDVPRRLVRGLLHDRPAEPRPRGRNWSGTDLSPSRTSPWASTRGRDGASTRPSDPVALPAPVRSGTGGGLTTADTPSSLLGSTVAEGRAGLSHV